MLKRLLFLLCGLALVTQAAAQRSSTALATTLADAYNAWRSAMIRKDAQAWASAITNYRQVVTRNEIVSSRKAFPEAVFTGAIEPPDLADMKMLEAEAGGTTAHLVYFGVADVEEKSGKNGAVLIKLKFGLEGGVWKFDSNRVTSLENAPTELKALESGQKPEFLNAPEFTPPGSFPPTPPLCRVPDFKAGFKLQSFGYETTLNMNGIDYPPVEHALDQQLIMGGLVRGKNEVTLRLKPAAPAEGQKPSVQLRIYKLDAAAPNKPGIEVLRWEAPTSGAPATITLPIQIE
ncbi:MAG: hypothetical protein IPK32_10740 [Verrucomicrobiaceae bacterium]|nr:hypothetical protein [Verrucomicrobiaceae bacterium]